VIWGGDSLGVIVRLALAVRDIAIGCPRASGGSTARRCVRSDRANVESL
jgi:hypothetical protein